MKYFENQVSLGWMVMAKKSNKWLIQEYNIIVVYIYKFFIVWIQSTRRTSTNIKCKIFIYYVY